MFNLLNHFYQCFQSYLWADGSYRCKALLRQIACGEEKTMRYFLKLTVRLFTIYKKICDRAKPRDCGPKQFKQKVSRIGLIEAKRLIEQYLEGVQFPLKPVQSKLFTRHSISNKRTASSWLKQVRQFSWYKVNSGLGTCLKGLGPFSQLWQDCGSRIEMDYKTRFLVDSALLAGRPTPQTARTRLITDRRELFTGCCGLKCARNRRA